MTEKNFKKSALALLLFSSFYFLASSSSAQTAPELIVTWKSNAYAPAGYQGKVTPTQGSAITVSAELLDASKPADLSRSLMVWRVDTELIARARGAKTITYKVPDDASGELTVDLSVTYQGVERTAVITIPVANPEVVINVPSLTNTVSASVHLIKALLYSFNIKNPNDLTIEWLVNDIAPEGSPADPFSLEINTSILPPGQFVRLNLVIQNPDNPTQIFSQNRQLIIQ